MVPTGQARFLHRRSGVGDGAVAATVRGGGTEVGAVPGTGDTLTVGRGGVPGGEGEPVGTTSESHAHMMVASVEPPVGQGEGELLPTSTGGEAQAKTVAVITSVAKTTPP